MNRLVRNLDDLHRLVRALTALGVRMEFVKVVPTFIGKDAPIWRRRCFR